MKMTEEQFDKNRKSFARRGLSDAQKQTMLARIYTDTPASAPVVSPLSDHFLFYREKIIAAVAAVVLVLSGTTLVSAHSLPGDPLYKVKVNVVEPIGLALRLSEESKNEYKVHLLQKRVDELRQLIAQESINADAQNASIMAADKNIKALEQSAIFDVEGKNAAVSETVEAYNSLIDGGLKIDTPLLKGKELPTSTESTGVDMLPEDLVPQEPLNATSRNEAGSGAHQDDVLEDIPIFEEDEKPVDIDIPAPVTEKVKSSEDMLEL